MPSAHGPCFVVRSCEKKSKRGSAFSRTEVSEHRPIICCNSYGKISERFYIGAKVSAHEPIFNLWQHLNYDHLDYETDATG